MFCCYNDLYEVEFVQEEALKVTKSEKLEKLAEPSEKAPGAHVPWKQAPPGAAPPKASTGTAPLPAGPVKRPWAASAAAPTGAVQPATPPPPHVLVAARARAGCPMAPQHAAMCNTKSM